MRQEQTVRMLCVCWMCAVGAGQVGAQQVDTQTVPAGLTILLYEATDRPVPWLANARVATERIFVDAGIRIAWIDCHGPAFDPRCSHPAEGSEFVVRMLGRRLDPASHACGIALWPTAGPGHYVTLFLDCIREGSDTFGVVEPVVAAYVIAHEIGHLLLSVEHAPRGIMRAQPTWFDWQQAGRGRLRFLPEEIRELQEALSRRALLAR